MTTVRELHTQAMALAQQALVQRESGNLAQAAALAATALTFEVDAAQLITNAVSSEPTRSIIYQSAASLALQAGKYAEAQRLVAEALTGFPPPRVEQELKELFEQINFAAHLSVRTDPLNVSEVQLAITGNQVGFGRVDCTPKTGPSPKSTPPPETAVR